MKSIQFTIRNVPPRVRKLAKRLAKEQNKTLNQVLLESLERGLGISEKPIPVSNFSKYAGTWQEDPEFDAAMEAFERIDEEMWK